MKHLFVKHGVLMEIFFIQMEFTTDTIDNSMDSFICTCCPTVFVLPLEFSVVISGEESCLVKERDDFIFNREDMFLLLMLHAIVALSIVTEKESQPVARHLYEEKSE